MTGRKAKKADQYLTISQEKQKEARESANKIKAGRDADQKEKDKSQEDYKKSNATKSRYRS